ncbi:MAG: hypothetical protein KF861_14645, partial [Planctomycetaceae bacterium]|nr:hypothetical protein [Planctomycetaceae bacterium]
MLTNRRRSQSACRPARLISMTGRFSREIQRPFPGWRETSSNRRFADERPASLFVILGISGGYSNNRMHPLPDQSGFGCH